MAEWLKLTSVSTLNKAEWKAQEKKLYLYIEELEWSQLQFPAIFPQNCFRIIIILANYCSFLLKNNQVQKIISTNSRPCICEGRAIL